MLSWLGYSLSLARVQVVRSARFICIYLLFFPTVNCQSCFNVQFVCGDGKCLNRENDDNGVCDDIVDCSDRSDEQRCGLLNGIDGEYSLQVLNINECNVMISCNYHCIYISMEQLSLHVI